MSTVKTTTAPAADARSDWQAHRELLRRLPRGEPGFRGCLGLALAVTAESADSWRAVGDHLFMPDAALQWVTVTDAPRGAFRRPPARAGAVIPWATARPTTVRYGMPVLARKTETAQFDAALTPPDGGRLARVVQAVQWAMTSSAYMFDDRWRKSRRDLFEVLGVAYNPANRLLLFGAPDEAYTDRESPRLWMPRAYLAFSERAAAGLFDRAVRPNPRQDLFPDEFVDHFVRDALAGSPYPARYPGVVAKVGRCRHGHGVGVIELHLKGDAGQHEVVRVSDEGRVLRTTGQRFEAGDVLLTENYWFPLDRDDGLPFTRQWVRVQRQLGHRFLPVLRLWFDRQAFRLKPGVVHVPSRVAAPAALGHALDRDLVWDVGPAQPYFRDDCDAFVFPTLPLRFWHDLRGVLPGAVAYDFTPGTPAFVSRDDYLAEQARRAAARPAPAA